MRQLRFIFIGIITFLFVTNAVFLRRTLSILLCGVLSFNSTSCYSFLDNYGKADAAAPPSKQIDLTGTWIGKGSKFTVDQRGCTLGYAGRLTADGQDMDQGTEFTVAQRGNQLIIPDQVITYSGGSSGSYTQHYQGTVSGNRVRFRSSTNALGQLTVESTGTVSNDGNTITGEMLCKTNAGPATAKGTFTWTRLNETLPNDSKYKLTIYVVGVDYFPGTHIAEPGGHAWISLSDGETTNYYSFTPLKFSQVIYTPIAVPGILRDAKGRKYDVVKEYIITKEGFKKARQAIVDWNDIYNLEIHNCATFAVTIGIAAGVLPEDIGLTITNNPASLGKYLQDY